MFDGVRNNTLIYLVIYIFVVIYIYLVICIFTYSIILVTQICCNQLRTLNPEFIYMLRYFFVWNSINCILPSPQGGHPGQLLSSNPSWCIAPPRRVVSSDLIHKSNNLPSESEPEALDATLVYMGLNRTRNSNCLTKEYAATTAFGNDSSMRPPEYRFVVETAGVRTVFTESSTSAAAIPSCSEMKGVYNGQGQLQLQEQLSHEQDHLYSQQCRGNTQRNDDDQPVLQSSWSEPVTTMMGRHDPRLSIDYNPRPSGNDAIFHLLPACNSSDLNGCFNHGEATHGSDEAFAAGSHSLRQGAFGMSEAGGYVHTFHTVLGHDGLPHNLEPYQQGFGVISTLAGHRQQ